MKTSCQELRSRGNLSLLHGALVDIVYGHRCARRIDLLLPRWCIHRYDAPCLKISLIVRFILNFEPLKQNTGRAPHFSGSLKVNNLATSLPSMSSSIRQLKLVPSSPRSCNLISTPLLEPVSSQISWKRASHPAFGKEHDLGDQGIVRHHHGHWPEQDLSSDAR